ncbi:hypothetical protein EDM56_13910 [Brevibacillus fluminis]|uniref:Uncharacterized protein n=1 Tax=Brevibacillus fluminis TaxID=511487 RepID=A0A3M8DKN8_9BACL|nr:hypothetical protein [Brevibacillus fluminis]RNB87667.1 hypothetical protein EDM56_13910 [Brevibacillus fluminis]
MKKFKRLAASFLIPALLLSISLPISAAEKQSAKQSNYKKLLKEGLSDEDATYYSELQDSLDQLKKENRTIDVDADAVSNFAAVQYSDDYIRKNKKSFREKILQHDPAAIRKATENALKSHFEGNELLSKLVKEDIKKNGKPKSFYEITFPSGDSMQATFETVKEVDSESDQVVTNASSQPYAGPWGSNVTTIGQGTLPSSSGNWGTSNDVKFYNAAGYASNYLQIKYTLDKKNTSTADDDTVTVYYTYSTGSSSGIMEVVTYNPNVGRPYDKASKTTNLYTQTFSDATMKLSAQVTGSYNFVAGSISVTLTHSTIWHEFSIIEVMYHGLPIYYGGYKL